MQKINSKRLKVLLIAEQCDPEGASVPLIAWNFFDELSQIVDVTLVTHERHEETIEKYRHDRKIDYIRESNFAKGYYKALMQLLTFIFRGRINWPLVHLLSLPIYLEFDHIVYRKYKPAVKRGEYDIVHAVNPTIPRFPVKISQACDQVPFILGPVNGGIPFPENFQQKAQQEFAHFNFIRTLGRYLMPGYVATYRKASKVLIGSSYTLNMLKKNLNLPDSRLKLFYENGIPKSFLASATQAASKPSEPVNLLFVGRLVPYKCADLVIEAIAQLDPETRAKVTLTIVGDGSEKGELEAKTNALQLQQTVHFTGWINHQQTAEYYRKSDIFCFPSIREFGGAVVLEAMANGLPCIVVNHGGIGEYVTEETGFKIEPISTEHIVQALTQHIKQLVENPQLRQAMSQQSIERAQEFEWSQKIQQLVDLYQVVLAEQRSPASRSKAAIRNYTASQPT